MRAIAIPVADRNECELALDVAFTLGKVLKADVVGYHMRPDILPLQADNIDMAGLWATGGLTSTAWPVDEEKAAEKLAAKAEKLFKDSAGSHGYEMSDRAGSASNPKALYHEVRGTPDQAIPVYGPASDMMIVSRPAKKGAIKAWMVMMTALLDSTVPVLILPQKKVTLNFKRMAIAWNNGPVEAMLVRNSLPLLKTADEVVFVTAGKETKHGPSAKQMIAYLRAHGIKATEKKVDGKNPAKSIEAAVKSLKADILLCGAYTRGRMREMIFGGVTEYLVTKTSLPVLMLHK